MKSIEIKKYKKLIDINYNQLLNNKGGIILLRNVDKKGNIIIHEIAKSYSDMAAFTIKDNNTNEFFVVLRYKSPLYITIDFEKSFFEGNFAYINGDYEKCIEIYLNALQYGKSNNKSFSILGFAYAKVGKYDEAIDYLTIANCLSRDGTSYHETINLLKRIKDGSYTSSANKDKTLKSLLRDNYKSVIFNGQLVLLDLENISGIENIERDIKDFPGMNCFIINVDGTKKLVLKGQMPIPISSKKISRISKKVENCYFKEEFDQYIMYAERLIIAISNPSTDFISKLSLSYARKRLFDKAIFYLNIARGLSDNNSLLNDYYNSLLIDFYQANSSLSEKSTPLHGEHKKTPKKILKINS